MTWTFAIAIPIMISAIAACSPKLPSNPEVYILSSDDLENIKFRIVNKSVVPVCYSSIFQDRDSRANPFVSEGDDGGALYLADSESWKNARGISLSPNQAVSLTAKLTDFYEIPPEGTYRFSIMLPVFPCDFRDAAGITAEWEREYGPNYLKHKGVSFISSSVFEIQRRR